MVRVVRVAEKGHASYWTVEEGRLLVGQTLTEVVTAMRNPRLSLGALAAMAGTKVSIWSTPFEGVQRLTFGHELHLADGAAQVRRWFHPERVETTSDDPMAVMLEAMHAAIDAAVTGAGVTGRGEGVGATVALSGGLDSTVLLALAAQNKRLRDGLQAYCAVPDPADTLPVDGRMADEWAAASAVAGHLAVPVQRLSAGGFNWLDEANEFHARNFAPCLVAPNLWWLRQMEARATAHGHRVILTGQSGNATFSHGPLNRIPPLLVDGTHENPRRRRSVRSALRGVVARRSAAVERAAPTAVRPGFSIEVPEHVLKMDPWTRWCLAEPPASTHGPYTGADVVWKDPLGSPEVITAAMSLPLRAWGTRVADRALARQVGVGLIPDQVRLNRVRGIQGADMPGLMLRHAASYQQAAQRVSASSTARQFLKVQVLERGVDRLLVGGDLNSARVFQSNYLSPLAVGLFAAWWDENRSR